MLSIHGVSGGHSGGVLGPFEKNNKLFWKKLDNPVRKNPNPPKLTATAQKILLPRLDPLK